MSERLKQNRRVRSYYYRPLHRLVASVAVPDLEEATRNIVNSKIINEPRSASPSNRCRVSNERGHSSAMTQYYRSPVGVNP